MQRRRGERKERKKERKKEVKNKGETETEAEITGTLRRDHFMMNKKLLNSCTIYAIVGMACSL